MTTRLREEAIQDVPIAITAFDSAAIEAVAPSTLRDFDGLAPNVFIGMNTAGPSAGAIYIRGLGYADIEKTQTSNVGIVVDGVFMPSSTGQLIDTFDIEQITVNRGPQAVLLGRNTSAGTIVVRRGSPKLGEWDAAGKFSYGNFQGGKGGGNQEVIQVMANMPINTETLAVRAGFTYKTSDGYWTNSFRGDDRGALDYQAFNIKLLYQPTEQLSFLLNWDWIRDRGDIPPQDPISDGDDPFVNRSDRVPEEGQVYDLSLPSLEVNFDTEFGKFTSITAYWNSRDLVFQDFDGGFYNAANPTLSDPNEPFARLHTRRHQFYDVFSQELRFAGDAFDGKLAYLGGFYFTNEDLDFQQKSEIILQVTIPGFPNLGAAGLCPLIGLTNGPPSLSIPGDQLCVFAPTYTQQSTNQDAKSYGIFGSLDFDVFEWWNLSGGLRWIKEKKDFRSRFAPLIPDINGTEGTAFITVPKVKDEWDDVVFEASTRFDIGELIGIESPLSTYYRYAEGFRSGGFSARATDPLRASFDPEDTKAHELGVKSELFDNRLTLNLAGFYTKVYGGQFSSIITIPTPPGTNTLILNAGETEVYGAELEIYLRPIDGLTLSGTFGYQEGEVIDNRQNPQDLPDPTNNNFPRPAGPPIQLATSDPLFRTPKFTGSVGVNYALEVGPGRLVADARWKHQDAYFIGAFGGGVLLEPNYELYEATLAYEWLIQEREVRAAFVGKNLSNSKYREQILFLGAGGFQGWGPPRYLGLELSFDL